MSDDELGDYFTAVAVANALRNGDFETFAKIVDVLHESGTETKVADLALAIIWDLLPDEAHDKMIAGAEAEGRSNVIDLFTRQPRK